MLLVGSSTWWWCWSAFTMLVTITRYRVDPYWGVIWHGPSFYSRIIMGGYLLSKGCYLNIWFCVTAILSYWLKFHLAEMVALLKYGLLFVRSWVRVRTKIESSIFHLHVRNKPTNISWLSKKSFFYPYKMVPSLQNVFRTSSNKIVHLDE